MNLVLVLILIAELSLGLAAWHSRDLLGAIAARLLVRRDVLEATEQAQVRLTKHWRTELGLDRERVDAVEEEA